MKKLVLVVLVVLFASLIGIYWAGYRGQRDFPGPNRAMPAPETVATNARKLARTPYDPLGGKYGDMGAKLGFIVCSDVPNIAYGLSGFSLRRMLEEDYTRNPSAYNTGDGNSPGSPYFHRRARNLCAYFKSNHRLLSAGAAPKVGDLVFYKRKSHGYVSHVALVTEVKGGDYYVMESAPETLIAHEAPASGPTRRGWILLGFGRMYSPVR
jgi:uncharacterized protein YijF (DUF1287 family)